MAQWGQGYQYPMQTGFNPQQQQFQQPPIQPGMASQPTGFPGQQHPAGFQQPQQTGFPGVQGYQQPQQQLGGAGLQQMGFQPLQAQPTGFQQQPSTFQHRQPPPVPPIPSQFQQNAPQNSAFLSSQSTNRLMSPSPGPLAAQPTGFPGGNLQPLAPQMTGFVDPRLQMMSSTFLPANLSMPFNPAGAPQLQQQSGFSLQQSFQQHNQAQRGTAAPKVPWALSKAEKKSYDQIFRAWDQRGEGFITGQTALEVFGQSGLDKNDLAKIWSLADADNRGKLNLAEFHVAMGLIYRRLNGNEIPDELPAELVPPSHRDLDNSVNFLKDILKNDTRARSPSNFDSGPISRLKERSFNSSSAPGAGGRQDATVYKYNDEAPTGGFYQPRSRHVDRSAIRTDRESESPSADLSEMKRQLENTAKMLDRKAEKEAAYTAEDEELDKEMDDLRYRVKRVQGDLDYVSQGPRSLAKDEERRKLERELLSLMHERLPELERKIKDREERKNREQREWNRERDRRNDRFGRFDERDRDRDDRYASARYDDRDRGYDSYDRDRSYRRDEYQRDRPYSRNRERDSEYDRPRSPPTARSPPPPPSAPTSTISKPPPPAPAPSASPAPALKKMTPEERKAFMQAEAQRRIQERMAALGVQPSASPTPKLDTSVEDRLAKEKKEAEEKAKAAEKEAEEREKSRQERLAVLKGESTSTPTTPTATIPSVPTPAVPALIPEPSKPSPAPAPAPAPAKARAPAPPPPRKTPASRPPVAPRVPIAQTPPVASTPIPPPSTRESTIPEIDPAEEELHAREAALRKAREERLERLRRMEEEEAAEAKRMEEEYQARRRQFTAPLADPTPAPATRDVTASNTPQPAPAKPSTPPPQSSVSSPPSDKSKTNPFSRLIQESSTPATPPSAGASNGGTNPFFKAQAAPLVSPPAAPPAPPVASAPLVVKTTYHTAPESDDDWGDVEEKQADDSSEDELDSSRDTRNRLAQQLFGSILPPSRPQSAAPTSARTVATPPPPAPPPPPPPTLPTAATELVFPPAPLAPIAPPAPTVATPAPSGDRNALLSAIQGGARLRKTQTNDRSGSALSGKVIGDAAPPEHIPSPMITSSMPQSSSLEQAPPPMQQTSVESANNLRSKRESVDWYAGLAADAGAPHTPQLSTMKEEDEDEQEVAHVVPDIQVEDTDPLQDVDRSIEYRVRSLFAYEGQRAEDLSFGENLILTAHPSKSGTDWWYGTLLRDGKSGFFPQTYVERVKTAKAKALYSYEGSNSDELPFLEGDELTIVDQSEVDWWKAEQSGVVFIVPAAYLELVEGSKQPTPVLVPSMQLSTHTSMASDPTPEDAEDIQSSEWDSDDDSFVTASESEKDDEIGLTDEQRRAEREARALERQRVLEAAGLIVTKSERAPPPRPLHRKNTRKRRPAPAVPEHVSSAKDLPATPEPDVKENSLRLDDAYERYEAYKQANPNLNRLSMASIETNSSALSPSPSLTLRSATSESEGRSHSHFFGNLFSRKTPTNDGERVMPIISGPITDRAVSPGPGTESEFGTSWASLVDKSALEQIPPKERRRQEAIFELITTESAYVRDLQLIVEVFYTSLISLLDPKAVAVLFANVEDILLVNTSFLSSLEERQKECRLYIDRIGDILKVHMSSMGVYMEYCINQAIAIKVLQSLRGSNQALASCLQRLREDPAVRNLDLSSYLLIPMQRVTRYPLLIKQILHYSEATSDRQAIEGALEISEKVLNHINETIREQEGRERLKEISRELWIGEGRLDLTAPTRNMGDRKLLKEGLLVKAKSGRRLRAFLCSDILVLTDEISKTLYRMPIPLSELQVKDVGSFRDELSFQIALAYPRGGDRINFRANSARDCQLWMDILDNASRRCREADIRAVRRR